MPPNLKTALKAIRQIGPEPVALNVLYRFGLLSGHYRRVTPARETIEIPEPDPSTQVEPDLLPRFCMPIPISEDLNKVLTENGVPLLREADEIVHGRVRLFGNSLVPLDLSVGVENPIHWTEIERKKQHWNGETDIKFVWEPARFGWAYTLARAYRFSGDETYAQSFWKQAQAFSAFNPPNLGPNWASGQEVALRLMALTFAGQVFSASEASTPNRMAALRSLIAAHAQRIPPTLVYARSQQNNHLISEAAGLLTAAAVLPEHPQAEIWRSLGWKWFNRAIQAQIGASGEYSQHSCNYHRLMLHLALWIDALTRANGQSLPLETLEPLARATLWLSERMDPLSGQVPNLGANDGALILPLSDCAFNDYRPVVQAAGRAFLGKDLLPSGPWDELSLWLNLPSRSTSDGDPWAGMQAKTLRIRSKSSWAALRVAHFKDRPSHADQLCVDLWWRGLNLALDPGAYLYNSPPPWDNSLAGASVHNSATVDGLEPMTRAGRFMWLDWDQAQVIERHFDVDGNLEWVSAERDGYKRAGVLHRRILACTGPDRWTVTDQLIPIGNDPDRIHLIGLSWLMPDCKWELDGSSFWLETLNGWAHLKIEARSGSDIALATSVVRAGKLVTGIGPVNLTQGWYSPTYAAKVPALAFIAQTHARLPITLQTEWDLTGVVLPPDSQPVERPKPAN